MAEELRDLYSTPGVLVVDARTPFVVPSSANSTLTTVNDDCLSGHKLRISGESDWADGGTRLQNIF